jgi:hypothetical protein
MGLGTGALVAGLFGMNVSYIIFNSSFYLMSESQLTSHLEEHPYAFFMMTGMSAGVSLLVAWTALHRHVLVSLEPEKFLTSQLSQARENSTSWSVEQPYYW